MTAVVIDGVVLERFSSLDCSCSNYHNWQLEPLNCKPIHE